jgi:hypothetical protein
MSPINHMKLAPNFKPHLAVSKDTSRYILMNVCVHHGMAIATNGRMMVAGLNEENNPETVNPVLLPLKAVADATKKRAKGLSPIQNVIEVEYGVTCKVRHNFDETTIYKCESTEKNYPNILKVLPDHAKPVSITFSAKLLKQLSDAIGEESVCLTFDLEDAGKCMIVTPTKVHDRFGLLMPTRFGERGDNELSKNKALERLRELSKETTVQPPVQPD